MGRRSWWSPVSAFEKELNMIAMEWAQTCLASHGFKIIYQPEVIQATPWSSVIRISTSSGFFYLKQTPPALFLEANIIQILHDEFHASVPKIIDKNKNLHGFLMQDAGIPLREVFKAGFEVNLLSQGIKQYTTIQTATINHIQAFLKLGVPDWRLEKLPFLYADLINRKDILIADGITNEELIQLHKLISHFSNLCQSLANTLPAVLDHCDFHDNNILLDKDKKITIIDLGETAITHPFFSLITCLRNAIFKYSIKEEGDIYLALRDACFESWLYYKSKNDLLKIMEIAKKLWPIYESLAQYRLMISCANEFKSANRRGRLVRGLKEFVESE